MKTTRRAFLQHLGVGAAGLWLGAAFSDRSILRAADIGARGQLPRATPQSQGISPDAIHAFLDAIAASKHEFQSFMLVRHGHVVSEGWWAPYAAELNHTMYSMSKSFTSTAIGLCVADGKLTVDDPVTSFFPDDLPAKISDNLAALKVKHLLTMSVGRPKVATESIATGENWVRAFLAAPIANQPGSGFVYDSTASYMLSAIVTRLTGKPVIEFLRPRLFEPLGIEGMTWQTCPRGINTGGWGLSIRTEGLAKFGQLYLHKGNWNGKQLIPEKWVEEATTKKIQQPIAPAKKGGDWVQGYCYQFWRCTHNAFRGDGAFGQFTVVMAEHDAVLAITGESSDLQGELDLVWKHILPALKDAPLPEDEKAAAGLQERLASLALKVPTAGMPTSPRAATISGKSFKLEANDMRAKDVAFTFTEAGCTFRLSGEKGDHAIACGAQKWAKGETDIPGDPPALALGRTVPVSPINKVAGSGTWADPDTFEMTWRFYETPHHDTVTCKFEGDGVKVKFLSSVAGLNPTRKGGRPELKGSTA